MAVFTSIVLQNSFLGCVQNFPGALVRVLKNYVRVSGISACETDLTA